MSDRLAGIIDVECRGNEECRCFHCDGVRMNERKRLRPLFILRIALMEYIRKYGIEHEGGCSEDDTCECPLVTTINDALKAALNV